MRYCDNCGAAFRFARTCPKDKTATSASTFDPMVGRVLGERYRILDRIGAGGMGQVYRAAHTRIACVFAVKVVWGDFAYDPTMQSRFVKEAEVASCLSSRHIVRVIDFAHDVGSLPYLVMEHLDGPTLFDVVSRSTALPPERATRIATQIARGLAHAHERGVVHRDLKPENVILVTEDDEHDVVKILDFGVARLRDSGGERLTGLGVSVGTPVYMAPEQLSAAEVDGRADLYSLGIVLYEMLTGKPPFESANLQELTRLHFLQPPPSIRSRLLASGGHAALDDVVRRLLAKHASDRFASAREVIEALSSATVQSARVLSVAPISTRSPVEATIYAVLRQTILAGAPRYNAGDHAGCYALYDSTANRLLQAGTEFGAVAARLEAGRLRAASRSNPTDAAWDMRYAFDDVLGAANIVIEGDVMVDELAAFESMTRGRELEGKFELLGDFAITFAQALANKLRSDPSHASDVAALEDAARRGREVNGGQSAINIIDPVLAKLRIGGAIASTRLSPVGANMRGRPSAPPMSAPASPRMVLNESIRQKLVRTIQQGAPAYDSGRPDVCDRLYRDAAEEIVAASTGMAVDPVSNVLKKALLDATGLAPAESAWVFRRAFDSLLSAN